MSGKVTAADDQSPLPGVNVLEEGTTNGTITDLNGEYSITLNTENPTLTFSFIGFAQKAVAVNGQSNVDVAMESDTRQLSGVLVTAAGIESNKRELGYSIQNVDAEEIVQARETNFVTALSGKVAGVQVTSSAGTPGAAAQIRIRGNRTVQGSNAPLFLIDGIPIDNSTYNTEDSPEDDVSNLGSGGVTNSNRAIDINPEDIESLTVLKGPAATVLYGIRAANGAVVITTKKGSRNTKPRISYDFGYTIDQVNKLPDLQTEYAQGSLVDGVPTFEAAMNGFSTSTSWGPRIADLRYADEESRWDPFGLIVPADDPRATDRVARSYNNADDFFQTGSNATHNISVSGGTAVT
ncbi:MAG: TonB-dependent receptor plug domain-containing protein, partial [Bacteroidota bacterium]